MKLGKLLALIYYTSDNLTQQFYTFMYCICFLLKSTLLLDDFTLRTLDYASIWCCVDGPGSGD
jgi:hypothetical protein